MPARIRTNKYTITVGFPDSEAHANPSIPSDRLRCTFKHS
jgi:hypothetical protein